jgi:hypothetical protein
LARPPPLAFARGQCATPTDAKRARSRFPLAKKLRARRRNDSRKGNMFPGVLVLKREIPASESSPMRQSADVVIAAAREKPVGILAPPISRRASDDPGAD